MVWGLLLTLVIILLGLPRELEICPRWEVLVTDRQERPKPGIEVHQQWRFYGISDEYSQKAITDANGRARFPARNTGSPPLFIGFGRAVSLIAIHSSFGPTASISISAPQSKGLNQMYWHGKLLGEHPNVSSTAKDRLETTFRLVEWDLIDAVEAGDFAFARRILKDNPSMANMRRVLGGTALYSFYTLKEGSIQLAKELIAAGCDVRATDEHSKTALHWAAARGQVELVALLLENGADARAQIKNPHGISEDLDTPLHLALHRTTADAEVLSIIALLVQHGADVNAKARFDNTPLHIAAYLSTPAVIRELRLRGARIDAKTSDGKTPMDLATRFHKSSNIQALRWP
jgi:hypothetical protein